MAASPWAVWSVLSDGRLYGSWVVGASRVRDIDANWPNVGAKIHHSVGVWPTLLNDETESLACVSERMLRLRARGRPFGQATVELHLTRTADGCEVRMLEDVTHGPGRLIPEAIRRLSLIPRNQECLKRLEALAKLTGPGTQRTG